MKEQNDAKTKLTVKDALLQLREAWTKGVEIGVTNNAERQLLRIVVANRVKALRVEHNITQEAFSEKVNVAFLTYKGYENRKSDIPLHTLVRIANELETSVDYLTGRTDAKEAGDLEDRIKKLEEAFHTRGGI